MGEQAIRRTTGQSSGVDRVVGFYQQLIEQDLRAAEEKRIAEQAATGSGTPAKKVSVSGLDGGWDAHERMLEAADQRQTGASKRKSAVETRTAATRKNVQGAQHRAIPEMTLGRGPRANQQVITEEQKAVQKPRKLGTSNVVPHRPMGAFGAQNGAVTIA